jgi:hypothetical protein
LFPNATNLNTPGVLSTCARDHGPILQNTYCGNSGRSTSRKRPADLYLPRYAGRYRSTPLFASAWATAFSLRGLTTNAYHSGLSIDIGNKR